MNSRSPPLFASLLLAVLAACGGSQQAPATGPAGASSTEPAPSPRAPGPGPEPSSPTPVPAAKPAMPATPGPNLTPDGVVFNYKPESKSKQIFLAGNFNNWNPADPKYLMKDDDGDGTWSITVKLPPGTYQYKYVIDGTWTKDPYSPGAAPDGFGGQNGKFDVK